MARFEAAGSRMTELLKQSPEAEGLWQALVKSHCCLAVCHWKVGNSGQAEKTYHGLRKLLVAHAEKNATSPAAAHRLIDAPLLTAATLREAKLPAPALALARESAQICSGFQSFPAHELNGREWLAGAHLRVATLLCQLKDASSSQLQAELTRSIYQSLSREMPHLPRYFSGLSHAWVRIGKASMEMERADKAVETFREAVRAQRTAFDLTPGNSRIRLDLSRCLDRVAWACGSRQDWAGAAEALLEQEKVWEHHAKELMDISRDFRELAKDMGRNSQQLLTEEKKVEQDHYLEESKRLASKAESLPNAMGQE